ncbi:MAG: hypothetical protein KDA60_20475 [Planctomycetales bacterium]|nr:hypothetical protein [Planctomycetales bacterium]
MRTHLPIQKICRLALAATILVAPGCHHGIFTKRQSELCCPTDIRKMHKWKFGEDAIFQSPCGPNQEFYGYRPTCWYEWPATGQDWRNTFCPQGTCEAGLDNGVPVEGQIIEGPVEGDFAPVSELPGPIDPVIESPTESSNMGADSMPNMEEGNSNEDLPFNDIDLPDNSSHDSRSLKSPNQNVAIIEAIKHSPARRLDVESMQASPRRGQHDAAPAVATEPVAVAPEQNVPALASSVKKRESVATPVQPVRKRRIERAAPQVVAAESRPQSTASSRPAVSVIQQVSHEELESRRPFIRPASAEQEVTSTVVPPVARRPIEKQEAGTTSPQASTPPAAKQPVVAAEPARESIGPDPVVEFGSSTDGANQKQEAAAPAVLFDDAGTSPQGTKKASSVFFDE